MRITLSGVRCGLFAGGIMASLAFGATQAVANPQTCNGTVVEVCSTQCYDVCWARWGAMAIPVCNGNCCTCEIW